MNRMVLQILSYISFIVLIRFALQSRRLETKPKEFIKGNVLIEYTGKTWKKKELDAKTFSLGLIILFEFFIILSVMPDLLMNSSSHNKFLMAICLFAFSLSLILCTLIVGYSTIYGNKEKTIQFYDWLVKIEDIRITTNDGKIFLLVKQGRVYQTYSIESFLQPYTNKYKLVNKSIGRVKYIEFRFNFKESTDTVVTIH